MQVVKSSLETAGTVEKENRMVKWTTLKFAPYLLGFTFRVAPEHRPLACKAHHSSVNARLALRAIALQPFSFDTKNQPGTDNGSADGLSCRWPWTVILVLPSCMPILFDCSFFRYFKCIHILSLVTRCWPVPGEGEWCHEQLLFHTNDISWSIYYTCISDVCLACGFPSYSVLMPASH